MEDFDAFVRAHGTALTRLAALVLGDRAAADDAVQEALTRAFTQWRRISALDSPQGYVRRMVVNECISSGRRSNRRRRTEGASRLPPPNRPMDQVELRGELAALLSGLGPQQRAVLVLRYLCDLPDREVAELVGCSESTVRSQCSRALASLRRAGREEIH